ncbi:MAG: hypothetical protein ACYS0G_11630 [Planctomycetota bacterium]|jgi:hypothetical protein
MVVSLLIAAETAGPPRSLGPALLLVGTTVLLLGLFFVGVVMLTRSYRRRFGSRRARPSGVLPDAWQEAGRRLEAPGSDPPGRSEDGAE